MPLRAKPVRFIRPLVRGLHGYVPGEQPEIRGLIKLNTNENPYSPSPKVLKAIRRAVDARLRLYPNPTAQRLREKLAKFHRCSPENIIVGNGSDELLALAVRCFVEPPDEFSRRKGLRSGQNMVQYFTPSYSLYPVLAAIHGALENPVALNEDFSLPLDSIGYFPKKIFHYAALTFVTTPNAPTGRGYSIADLERLCRKSKGVVILDEAYVDFADENALPLALKYSNVIVSRTFSKAYSLCFQRVGYFVGPPKLIAALDKIRDSYNVNGLGQVAALATLSDLGYYRKNFQKIKATRERLRLELIGLGFSVCPSQTNFLFARPPKFPAREWLEKLRAEKILVRWFNKPEAKDFLRITVGADQEADALIQAARKISG